MSDHRRHRGPHPEDHDLFSLSSHPALRAAVTDLSWLLSRDYASPSAIKIVGDRYHLTARQRIAIMRCACSDAALASRQSRQISLPQIAGQRLLIDGYNVLTTIEAAMAGGIILVGRDSAWRDMASMHGTWRKVEETAPALERIAQILTPAAPSEVLWYLDAPVSNSGRLKSLITQIGAPHHWQVELVPDPDKLLSIASPNHIVATADSAILDACDKWINLPCRACESIQTTWKLDCAT